MQTKEYKSINLNLTPIGSEMSQYTIEKTCNEMASEGWGLLKFQVYDDYNIMLMFQR